MSVIAREELLATAEDLAGLGSWSLELGAMECTWSDGMYRIHGLAPQSEPSSVELTLSFIHPDDRPRITDMIRQIREDSDSFGEDIDFDYKICRRDGSVREIRARARLEGGRFLGVAQDVTEQRMTERELRAHYAITQTLRDWESFEEGVISLLQRTGTALDFPLATMWRQDQQSGELVCIAVWARPDLDVSDWEVIARTARYAPGEGLPGRAWMVGRPMVSPDIARDPNARRPEIITERGLTSALFVPATPNGEPVAMLGYFSYERRDPSPRLIRTLTTLGSELGRFLAARRAQLEPSPLSKRELEVLALAAEGLTGPQIAERLIVSPSTVKTHFENIYEKLGIGDRAGAVAYALRVGLIT